MFEVYDINNLYYCTIHDCSPIDITTSGDFAQIQGYDNGDYDTIVCRYQGVYVDIYNKDRIINTTYSEGIMPKTSKNQHLYTLDMKSLKKYTDKLPQSEKSIKKLQRLPFGKTRTY